MAIILIMIGIGLYTAIRPYIAVVVPILLAISVSMVMLPKMSLKHDLEKLELMMPHLILKLRILILAGVPPLQAFIDTAKTFKNPCLDMIIKKIMLGEDAIKAVESLKDLVGSKPVIDILKRVINALSMGESAHRYIANEFEALLKDRERELDRALENVSSIIEIYVSMGVFAPVVGIIILTAMAFLGGIDVQTVMMLLIFIAVPILSIFTSFMAKKFIERSLI